MFYFFLKVHWTVQELLYSFFLQMELGDFVATLETRLHLAFVVRLSSTSRHRPDNSDSKLDAERIKNFVIILGEILTTRLARMKKGRIQLPFCPGQRSLVLAVMVVVQSTT